MNVGYFNQCQSVALTVFGISAGIAMRFVHRYKSLLVVGLSIRLLYVFHSSTLPSLSRDTILRRTCAPAVLV